MNGELPDTPDTTDVPNPALEALQRVTGEPTRARHNKLISLGLAVAIGASALAGCGGKVEAGPTEPSPSVVTTDETPSQSPEVPAPTLDEAREALKSFKAPQTPVLYEFSTNADKAQAKHDAEAYLALKDSRLALVNYTDLSPEQAEDFGNAVKERITYVTHGTFAVEVDVYQANDVAKALYEERTTQDGYHQDEVQDYASVVADVAMPEIDEQYASVIALTDSGFDGKSFAYYDGKYADVANVYNEYTDVMASGGNGQGEEGLLNDPRNSAVHEWLHAVARLEHAKAATVNGSDLSGSFTANDDGSKEADLVDFLTDAHVEEYGGGGIMGATHDIGDDLRALRSSELYQTEAAERALGLEHAVTVDSLTETRDLVYGKDTKDTVVTVDLEGPVTVGNDENNTIYQLDVTPMHDHGEWYVRIEGQTADNAKILLSYIDFYGAPDSGSVPYVINLPSGNLSIQLLKSGDMQLSLS